MTNFKAHVRDVPDFPKCGIVFKDIAPLLANPTAFQGVIEELANRWDGKVDAIAALDARGFLFGGALAARLQIPLGMVRKKGKLPRAAFQVAYGLEYGEDVVEMQEEAFAAGARVLVLDDLLATGGTAAAACTLVKKVGATVAGCAFIIELTELNGRAKLGEYRIDSLMTY
ncbi:MAG: adenine phosphoribosyltransferase [Parcubacteria bacterium C7867-001]|nr:MAG: adenine phosphoribosyltransferase [Parcubacteria bacterium C7867-001]